MNSTTNRQKLRSIVRAFDISPTDVARIAAVSRPYVARLLSEADDFSGSSQFWATLERKLGEVIAARKGQVFEVEALPAEQIQSLTTAA